LTKKELSVIFIARGKHLEEIKKKGLLLKTDIKEIKVIPDYALEILMKSIKWI